MSGLGLSETHDANLDLLTSVSESIDCVYDVYIEGGCYYPYGTYRLSNGKSCEVSRAYTLGPFVHPSFLFLLRVCMAECRGVGWSSKKVAVDPEVHLLVSSRQQ